MTVIIYHDDNDGRCAAAIAMRVLRREKVDPLVVVFVPAMYNKRDEIVDAVGEGDEIFVVDFSFTAEQFGRLVKKSDRVTWIDHHKSAIAALDGTPFMALPGKRDVSRAACLLAWEYWYPDALLPDVVKFIADRDAWIWNFGIQTAEFHYGLSLFDTAPTAPIWGTLFEQPAVAAGKLRSDGRIVLQALEQRFKEIRAAVAFDTHIVVPGAHQEDPKRYSVRAMNIAIAGSAAFGAPGWETGALPDDVDICCQYYHNGEVFTISLYSKKGGVDVSEICKSFGGGGHAGAAGFTSKELPAFLRKISDG